MQTWFAHVMPLTGYAFDFFNFFTIIITFQWKKKLRNNIISTTKQNNTKQTTLPSWYSAKPYVGLLIFLPASYYSPNFHVCNYYPDIPIWGKAFHWISDCFKYILINMARISHIYIYIYIFEFNKNAYTCVYLQIFIYIYMHKYIYVRIHAYKTPAANSTDLHSS